MKYCIAIDGGGTKTDTVLFDTEGNILARHVGPGNNPTDIGCDEARKRLMEDIDAVYHNAGGAVETLYGGIAGTLPMETYTPTRSLGAMIYAASASRTTAATSSPARSGMPTAAGWSAGRALRSSSGARDSRSATSAARAI